MKCRKNVPFFHNNLEFIWLSNETTVHLNGIEDAEHFHQWTIYILRLFHQIKWRCQQFSKFLSSRRHVSKEAQMRNAATWTNGAPNSTQSKQKSNRTMLKRNINCVCVCVSLKFFALLHCLFTVRITVVMWWLTFMKQWKLAASILLLAKDFGSLMLFLTLRPAHTFANM